MSPSHRRRDPKSMSRRALLRALAANGGVLLAGTIAIETASVAAPTAVRAASVPPAQLRKRAVPLTPELWRRPSGLGAPPVQGLHLTFGDDPATEAVVSWTTSEPVRRPQVQFGAAEDGFGDAVEAESTHYVDGHSGRSVAVHSARLRGLDPDSIYVYAALHDGAVPELGTIRTAPDGRAPFTFTSFGDMGAPFLTSHTGSGWGNDGLGTESSFDLVEGIERVAPLFNLINGDLSYAGLANDRLRTWSGFLANISRSARHRAWMPSAGNHENEAGNGPIGYSAFQTYFPVPNSGATGELRGLWYAYTVGNVRFVHLQNDDVCLQDGGNTYVHGYSGGAQQTWLEHELSRTRADESIDWIVVCMHQVAISTADHFNGADLGVRQSWLPLFDHYGVDLVLCGHEHHYERSHPIRGAESNPTATPIPQDHDSRLVDTTKGTVHMVLGGGGNSASSNSLLTPDRRCRVITEVAATRGSTGKREATYVWENADWSSTRDAAHPHGFAAFSVDGSARPGTTTIDVTYYGLLGAGGQLAAVDSFVLTKPAR